MGALKFPISQSPPPQEIGTMAFIICPQPWTFFPFSTSGCPPCRLWVTVSNTPILPCQATFFTWAISVYTKPWRAGELESSLQIWAKGESRYRRDADLSVLPGCLGGVEQFPVRRIPHGKCTQGTQTSEHLSSSVSSANLFLSDLAVNDLTLSYRSANSIHFKFLFMMWLKWANSWEASGDELKIQVSESCKGCWASGRWGKTQERGEIKNQGERDIKTNSAYSAVLHRSPPQPMATDVPAWDPPPEEIQIHRKAGSFTCSQLGRVHGWELAVTLS